MRPNIMFVDDSLSVREALQWLFKDEPYYLFGFDNPLDALSVIKSLEWAVVVADRSLQNMDGLEFLQMVRAYSPNTVGIIMTDYNESPGASDALYPGCAYRFVKKPLDNNEIKQAVKEAIAQYEINTGGMRHEIYK